MTCYHSFTIRAKTGVNFLLCFFLGLPLLFLTTSATLDNRLGIDKKKTFLLQKHGKNNQKTFCYYWANQNLSVLDTPKVIKQKTTCQVILQQYAQSKPTVDIKDTLAFCKGVTKADTAQKISLRWAKNSFMVSTCTKFIHDKYGIKLVFTGNNKLPILIDENIGYNFVMKKRIKKELRINYDKKIVTDNSFFSADELIAGKFVEKFNKHICIKETWLSNIKIILKNNSEIFPSYLNKITITDRKHKQTFKFGDLYNGVKLMLDQEEEQRQIKQLHFSFETLTHPKFCRRTNVNENYVVSLSLKKFFDKWKD